MKTSGVVHKYTHMLKTTWLILLTGLISGVMTSFMEIGLSTVTTDGVSIPYDIIESMGLDASALNYQTNGQVGLWEILTGLYIFSILASIVYCAFSIKFNVITACHGMLYSLSLFLIFYVIVLPAIGWIPVIWESTFDNLITVVVVTLLWGWTLEVFRYYFVSHLSLHESL
jgi:uncharacterized membrane protein YagU involved in acid resistance